MVKKVGKFWMASEPFEWGQWLRGIAEVEHRRPAETTEVHCPQCAGVRFRVEADRKVGWAKLVCKACGREIVVGSEAPGNATRHACPSCRSSQFNAMTVVSEDRQAELHLTLGVRCVNCGSLAAYLDSLIAK